LGALTNTGGPLSLAKMFPPTSFPTPAAGAVATPTLVRGSGAQTRADIRVADSEPSWLW